MSGYSGYSDISSAIKAAAAGVNPYATEAARLLQVLESEVHGIPTIERTKLDAALQKLPTCWRERYWPLKFSKKFTHAPSSSDFYISFLEGWHLAEILHDGRRQLVVGFKNQEEFLQKLQRFVATLPECPEWAREQHQLMLKKKEHRSKEEERDNQQISFRKLLLLKKEDDRKRAALKLSPRPPTKAETHAAFFVLTQWLKTKKSSDGRVYDESLEKIVCIPSIPTIGYILKEAERLNLTVLSNDQISEMVEQAKWVLLSDADKRLIAFGEE
jgi:hypothetical protein